VKIAVLGTRGFPNVQGGVEAHCEKLYPRLAKAGCEVTVFTRKPYVDASRKEYKGVKLDTLPCPKNKFFEAFFHTFLGIFAAKKKRSDILHIHAIGPSLLVPFARFLGLKVVMTNHGPDYERKKWPKPAKAVLKLGEKLGSKKANKVICVSEYIAHGVREKYGREPAVIPNGVEPERISQGNGALKKYGLTKDKYILAVGRFVPEKGFGDLIEAFEALGSLLLAPGSEWKLVIVGRADHEDTHSRELKGKASKNKNVILTGFLTGEPLRELYSHAGLFVLPSYYEGLPIALLEAMSYGLSCIASDIPANREVGLDENRYFRVGDKKQLSEKIKEYTAKSFSSAEKKKQMDLVAERYNWDRIAASTLEVYKSALGS